MKKIIFGGAMLIMSASAAYAAAPEAVHSVARACGLSCC